MTRRVSSASGSAPRLLLAACAMLLFGSAGCGDDGGTVPEDTCADLACGSHGDCVEGAEAGLACVCDTGYAGAQCDDCAEGYSKSGAQCLPEEPQVSCAEEDPCGEHGTCQAGADAVSCRCDPGYLGETCAECAAGYHENDDGCVIDVECRVTTCSRSGTCDDSSGTPVCECNDGYEGDNCSECASGYHEDGGDCSIDEQCGTDSCPAHATCDDSGGVVTCTCEPGYSGVDCDECSGELEMNDEGECVEPVAACEPGYARNAAGDCVATPVECDDGELGVELADGGVRCEPGAASCSTDDNCAEHGTCDDSGGVVTCVCEVGYAGATCSECAAGYQLQSGQCVVSLTCLEDSCSGNGACDAVDGALSCTCVEGYAGETCAECDEGYWLAATGECEPGETCEIDTCSTNALCSVSEGLASCACFAGYAGEDCSACAAGYHREGNACEEDKVCAASTCSSAGTCDDTDGTIECACNEGYAGERCQGCAVDYTRSDGLCVPVQPPDVCANELCAHGTCDDSTGEAACICEPHYKGIYCNACIANYVMHPDGVCRPTACGDSVVDSVNGENCDDGNTITEECAYAAGAVPCSVCTSECIAAPGALNFCGDGNLDTGEVCDDGVQNGEYSPPPGTGLCAVDCSGVGPYCGDGLVEDIDAGLPEECDDGNTDGGCSSSCVVPVIEAGLPPETCVTYTWSGSQAIPDSPAGGTTTTFAVTESLVVTDVNLKISVSHAWISDLGVDLLHGVTSVNLANRPGTSCNMDNWVGAILDDEGTTNIQATCSNNLSSPPNYIPNNPLSGFDALNSAGDWVVTVSDRDAIIVGTFTAAELVICGTPVPI